MASLNKANIVVATNKKAKLDLTFDHVTSQNFLQLQPVGYRHMIKGEKLSVNTVVTCRPAPMAVPTYGRMRLNLRYFFVPYRVVFPQWDSFYTDVIGSNYGNNSLVTDIPVVQNDVLVNWFLNTISLTEGAMVQTVTTAVPPAPQDPYDFQISGVKYKFTPAGKRRLKVLHSLGYRLNYDTKDNTKYSALALLAYAKIYVDWYANSQYLNSADVLQLKQIFSFNNPASQLILSNAEVSALLNLITTVVYDGNYFVSAWDNPVSPNAGQFSSFSFADPTSSLGSLVGLNANGTPEMRQNAASSVSLGTQYLHSALKMLTDYSKRHQLAGAYEIDRYLAQFGVATTALKHDRSIYLGSKSIDINVGDVMSTADTASAGNPSTLGDYAGSGFGQNNSACEFTTDEFGILIACSSILPSGGYWQGIDRHNLHLTKFDFFQPEADSLGVQAIAKREVYMSNDTAFALNAADYNGIFGYSARYAEYKRSLSNVTGDPELPASMQGGDAWHLMRTFNDANFGSSVSNVVHSLDFTRGKDYEEFNRIFNYTGSDYDKFFVDYHFDMHALAPCRSLFDTYDFEDGNQSVTLDSNGAKLN